MKTLFHRLLSKLTPSAGGIALREDLYRQMQDIAAEQGRREGEVVSDLLALGLERDRLADPLAPRWRTLTARERQVAALLAHGHSNGQISMKLGISEGTVRTHVRHLHGKYAAADRPALRAAIQHEIGRNRYAASDFTPR